MKIYVNDKLEIKDVNTTNDNHLIEYEIDDENNPFTNWSVAKICCYKVTIVNNMVTSYTPYVDSRLVEHIDKLGKKDELASTDILDTQMALTETFEKALSAEADITDIQLALVELYEMIMGGN